MTQSLYVHVGPYKTGTTTLQAVLFANQDELRKEGLNYWPIDFMDQGHHLLPLCLVGEFSTTPSRQERAVKDFARGVGRDTRDVVVSSEMFSRFDDAYPYEKLAYVMKGIATVKIVAYTREQRLLLPSYYKTQYEWGLTRMSYDEWVRENINRKLFLNYDRWLDMFARVFGEENVIVQPFRPRNPRHAEDFLERVGYTGALPEHQIGSKNLSRSNLDIQTLHQLTMVEGTPLNWPVYDPPREEGGEPIRRGQLKELFWRNVTFLNVIRQFYHERGISGDYTFHDRALYDELGEHFAPINEAVSRRWFDGGEIFGHEEITDFQPDLRGIVPEADLDDLKARLTACGPFSEVAHGANAFAKEKERAA